MPLPDLAQLSRIAEPFEWLELANGESRTLRVERHELGSTVINPRDDRDPFEIPVLRVHVPPADKPTIPAYWDISAKHLIAGMLGYLDAAAGKLYTFRVTKRGQGPAARFTLDARPR